MTANGDILFLVHRIPFPPDRGDKIRSYHMLKALAEMAPVHVGCFTDDDRDMGFAPDLARVAASQCVVKRDRSKAMAGLAGLFSQRSILVSIYENPELHRWVSEILATRPIRAIVAYSVQMAAYVPHDLPSGCRFMMDFVDFDSAKYAAYGSEQDCFMGWVNRREGRVLLDFEREVARRATISTFVSDAEAQLFAQTAGVQDRNVQALDNGVNLSYFNIKKDISPIQNEEKPLLVFTGQMDYRPNIEAVESFAREALPIVRAKYPTATFAIVGRNPTPQVQALALQPGVIVTGGVPDIRGWLMAADVVVAPLRIARGIQNKVLEAMAMGRPVVASPQAAEGIDAVNGEHFVVAADPQAEAEAVRALLADPQQAELLGKAARARMEQRYDWAATLEPLREMVLG